MKSMKIRFFTRTGDKIVFWVLIALMAVITIVSLMGRAGLQLVHGELYIYLPLMLLLLLAGWGLSAIFRRLRGKVARGVGGAIIVLVMLALITLGMTYGGVAAGLSFPQRYIDMTSPENHRRVIVLRGLDTDESRVQARHAARLAADPEGSPDLIAEDWGYTFTAYAPGPLNLFYKVDSLREGEGIHIGYVSKAELMVEWEDDETIAHFYIKNPEPQDEGELRVAA